MRSSSGTTPTASAVPVPRLPSVLLAGGIWLAALVLAAPAPAQTASPPAASPAADSEVTVLPEFEVSNTRPRGEWVASQALSGTRTAANLIELPFQVQVLTEEFLADFELNALGNQMSFFTAYSSGSDLADPAIGGSGQAGNMLRGFTSTIIRDGFSSNGTAPPPTISNTAQVENIKGPISTLYGDAEPGGLINYISKRPTLAPRYSLTLSAGSYDYFRSNLSASGPAVGNKLYYLVSIDHMYRESAMQYTSARTGDYLVSLLWKPAAATSLKVTYEAVRLKGARAASIPYRVVGTRVSATNPLSWSGGTIVGIDWDLARAGYSRFGPTEKYNRDYDGINALLEHAYSRNWKQRVSYQTSWKHFDLDYRTNSNVSAETGRMTGVQPNRRVQTINAPNSFQTDLLGKFTTGAIRHELLFNADYAAIRTRDYQLRLPTNLVATLDPRYTYQDPANPYWPDFDHTLLTRYGSKGFTDLDAYGCGVGDRLFFQDDRLILMGNLRYAKSKFGRDTSTTTDAFIRGSDDGYTHALGVNYRVLGDTRFVLFANHSTSFNANPTIDANTGTTIPNEEGEGLEAGFKTLSRDGRFGFTLSTYQIEKTNIGQTNPDYVRGGDMPQYLGSGIERVRGIDGDFSWQLNRSLMLNGGASYLDSEVASSSDRALVGTRKIQVPLTTASAAAKYNFSGPLQGLSAGAAFRYTGSYVRANATATRLYEESAPRQLTDIFVSYAWRSHRLRHRLKLNVNNLFDKFYVGPELNKGMGRQVNFSYNLEFR